MYEHKFYLLPLGVPKKKVFPFVPLAFLIGKPNKQNRFKVTQ